MELEQSAVGFPIRNQRKHFVCGVSIGVCYEMKCCYLSMVLNGTSHRTVGLTIWGGVPPRAHPPGPHDDLCWLFLCNGFTLENEVWSIPSRTFSPFLSSKALYPSSGLLLCSTDITSLLKGSGHSQYTPRIPTYSRPWRLGPNSRGEIPGLKASPSPVPWYNY